MKLINLLFFFCLFILANPIAYAIINGAKTNDEHLAIGSIVAFDNPISFCTATLIRPDWIVLAGHCRSGGSEEEPITYEPEQMTFQIGFDSRKPALKVKLAKWVEPENPKTNDNEEGEEARLDIAFAQLASPITHVNKIPLKPIPLLLSNLAQQNQNNFEIAGYGYTQPVGFGSETGLRLKAKYKVTLPSDDNKNPLLSLFGSFETFKNYLQKAHSGEEEIAERHLFRTSRLLKNYQVHAWDPSQRDNGHFTDRPPLGWSNSCNGDSGGPLLLNEGTQKRVAGIIQSGFTGNTLGCVELGSIIGVYGPEVLKTIREYKLADEPVKSKEN